MTLGRQKFLKFSPAALKMEEILRHGLPKFSKISPAALKLLAYYERTRERIAYGSFRNCRIQIGYLNSARLPVPIFAIIFRISIQKIFKIIFIDIFEIFLITSFRKYI